MPENVGGQLMRGQQDVDAPVARQARGQRGGEYLLAQRGERARAELAVKDDRPVRVAACPGRLHQRGISSHRHRAARTSRLPAPVMS